MTFNMERKSLGIVVFTLSLMRLTELSTMSGAGNLYGRLHKHYRTSISGSKGVIRFLMIMLTQYTMLFQVVHPGFSNNLIV